ncbi:Zn-dependent hydrolase [Aerosakkonemataceae cyanobacterium BLCC-F154]|uniref:Zn-dependent hydrolase n=1 Tax=Floridaenema fluviatile BLCC-F154 TaxID=3153640 RepID=A0ABV4Y6J3_9CYAN
MMIVSPLFVNSDRLNRSIETLAQIGQVADGGVTRIAFSPEDIAARNLVQNWMREAGMNVRIDAAGNMIGCYQGKQANFPALATGSHIDTVPNGGPYDGALGVLAGIEIVRAFKENNIRLEHSIEVIVFTDEESTMIGSKAMAGTAKNNLENYRLADGKSIGESLGKIGGNWDELERAKRDRSQIAAYIELHVEQGGILENLNKQIGVVEGVVGAYRGIITVTGKANHAGTTPMEMRQDALVAAAQIVLQVNNLGNEKPGNQVATVGKFNVFPNATNIVPGQVEMSVDIRDLSADRIKYSIAKLEQQLIEIAANTQTKITLKPYLWVEPTLAASDIVKAIADVCDRLKLSHHILPSRAGHDAQEIGRFTNMGMIFVPSIEGISHSPKEHTTPEQCTQGTNVLLQTFLQLDRIYSTQILHQSQHPPANQFAG